MPQLNLSGIPWFVGRWILNTIHNETCKPDHVLLMADALEETAKELPAQTVYRAPCDRVVVQLRELATNYDKAVATGSTLEEPAP